MESQIIHCPNCLALVPAADINIAALIAKCGNCNHVFPLPADVLPTADRPKEQAPPACPSGIVCETGPGGELYIRRRWFQPTILFLLMFCILWDGFLAFWYAMALFGNGPRGGAPQIMLFIPLVHVAIGVGLTYYVLAGLLNSTRILIDADALHLRHRPIPWFGNRDLARSDIRGIELDVGMSRNYRIVYNVSVNHASGRQLGLLSNINRRQARYIGYQIARHLGVDFSDCETGGPRLPLPRWMQRWAGLTSDR